MTADKDAHYRRMLDAGRRLMGQPPLDYTEPWEAVWLRLMSAYEQMTACEPATVPR